MQSNALRWAWNRLLKIVGSCESPECKSRIRGLCESPHCKAACERLLLQRPSWVIRDTRVVKREATRCVVAVFYKEPRIITRPTRYKLFGVSNDSLVAEELPCDPDSPYWIRGRK